MNPPHPEAEPHTPGKLGWLALLPILLLLAAIIAARLAGLRDTYESQTLLLVLSFTFYTLVSLGTLYLIGRSFLALGSPGLLLLECGVLLWSLSGTVGDFVSHGDANINVTIFNTGILLAGLCHLAGAILALRPQRVLRAKPLWLGVGCAIALTALWLVAQASLSGWLPVFFIPGLGGTPVRYFVLISAISMFVLSAGVLLAGQRNVRIPFTFWYSLALLLLAVGLFGVMIQLSLGSAVNWLSRTAQWLGGVYLLFAAIASFRESQLPLLPPEKQSQSAYYREAIAVAVVLAAAAIRLAFLSALGMHAPFITFYPAVMFASIYGGLRAGLLATALSALLADYFWIEPAGRFTIGQPADWLGLVIFVLSGAMISWIADEMHRARARAAAAEAVREMQRETEFLANLLERSSQAFAVGYADGRLGRFNHAYERLTGYTAADLRALDWSATLTPPEWRELEKQQLDNLRRTGQPVRYEKEYIRKDGSHVPIELLVHLARDAGGNPEYYYAFVTDITGRKRAEIALRQSEERYRTLFNMLMEGFCIIKVVFDSDNTPVDYRFLECNPAFEAQTGLQNAQGKLMRELAPDHEAHWFEIYGKVALTGEAARFENEARALNRWYDVYAYRIGRPEDHHVAIIFNDITDRKREEERIRRHADSLRAKNEELERVNRVMVGRELRMIELKKEVNELCVRAGLQPPYQIDSERAQS